MNRDGLDERRRGFSPVASERRGAFWSLPGGARLPNALDGPVLILGSPDHPARLLPADLDNPEGFHLRLTAWLLQQG